MSSAETQSGTPSVETSKEYDKEAALKGIADQLVTYSLEVEEGDVVWIRFETMTGGLAKMVCEKIDQIPGAQYRISFLDDSLDKTMLESVSGGKFAHSKAQVKELLIGKHTLIAPTSEDADKQAKTDYLFSGPMADQAKFLENSNKVLSLVSRKNLQGYDTEADLEKAFAAMSKPLIDIRVKERRWCLYRPPSPMEAEAAGMPFEDYEKVYYEACNRPWAEVEKAQAVLVDILEQGKKITVTSAAPEGMDANRWATHVEMGINGKRNPESGVHTFVNSVAKRNMPGSEVFTGPDAGTLTGRYALPYPVMLKDRVVKNLILRFENGRVAKKEDGSLDFDTDGPQEDRDHIEKILSTDEGASAVGELGIGTNPVVNFPVLNTMLNEKISGIHLAIGSAYTYTDYLGTPVDIDNGNRSANHIDLSRVMTEAYGGGQMVITKDVQTENGVEEVQEVIFENGKFLDPRLAILNGDV